MTSAGSPGRLGIGVISAGKVGAVLAATWRRVGHAIVGAHAISQASRERAQSLLPDVPLLDPADILRRSELVLLAVPDDALTDLVRGLAASPGWQMGQIVVHTSGRYGTEVLAPAMEQGAIGVALHPAMTFSGYSLDCDRLVGCPVAVTAQEDFAAVGQALAMELGGEPFLLPEASRPAYHAAMAHGANHLVTLVNEAVGILQAAGVSDGAAALSPLLHTALERVLQEGEDALTGPIARGDSGTVASHVTALQELAQQHPGAGMEETLASYRALARATIARRQRSGRLRPDAASALRQALGEGPQG